MCFQNWRFIWFIDNANSVLRLHECTASDVANLTLDREMSYLNHDHLAKLTGCTKPCFFWDYPATRSSYRESVRYDTSEQSANDTNRHMSMVVYFKDQEKEYLEEFKTFDEYSLVGELGGFLGLFLGVSFYQALTGFLNFATKTNK